MSIEQPKTQEGWDSPEDCGNRELLGIMRNGERKKKKIALN